MFQTFQSFQPFKTSETDHYREGAEDAERSPTVFLRRTRDCVAIREERADVMVSGAKHLAFFYEVEILRLRLRMTLRHSLHAGEDDEGGLERLERFERERSDNTGERSDSINQPEPRAGPLHW